MRLHVHDPNPFRETLVITIDGNQVQKCHYADEEAGFVDFYATDAHGDYMYDMGTGNPKSVRLFGEVVIRLHPGDDENERRRDCVMNMMAERDTAHRYGRALADMRRIYEEDIAFSNGAP